MRDIDKIDVKHLDGSTISLHEMDGGVLGLFDKTKDNFRKYASKSSVEFSENPNDGAYSEIYHRLTQSRHCYFKIRHLHAAFAVSCFKHQNELLPNSAPEIIFGPYIPLIPVPAYVIHDLEIYLESLYLYIARVVQIIRDGKNKPLLAEMSNVKAKGALMALNNLVKHADAFDWGGGTCGIPLNLSEGIILKPGASAGTKTPQDKGTIANSFEFLNQMNAAFDLHFKQKS